MKKLFRVVPNGKEVNIAILTMRIAIAVLMLVHGIPKLLMLISGDPIQFPGILGLGPTISLIMAVFAEVVCSLLIFFGLGTRLASIPLAFTMLVAIFHVHAADPFAIKELALHYLLTYAVLFLLGSGRYSLDALMVKERI